MRRIPRKLFLIVGLAFILLLFYGCAIGPIGAKLAGTDAFIAKPKIHLPSDTLFHLGPFPVSNTILASWVTMAFLIVLFAVATRRAKLVPGRFQSFAELMVETLARFCENMVGRERGRMVFPLVATIFLFVAFNAWLSLLPIYGPVVLREAGGHEGKMLLRNAGTDINLPLAIALFSVVFVEYWGIRAMGAGRYMSNFISLRGLLRGGLMSRLVGLIQIFVGLLEMLSHLIRLLSFTFRLFGNMTAGKALLLIATFLAPFVFSTMFYGLELLIGFVQALIFAGLTLAFAAVAFTPHEEGH